MFDYIFVLKLEAIKEEKIVRMGGAFYCLDFATKFELSFLKSISDI